MQEWVAYCSRVWNVLLEHMHAVQGSWPLCRASWRCRQCRAHALYLGLEGRASTGRRNDLRLLRASLCICTKRVGLQRTLTCMALCAVRESDHSAADMQTFCTSWRQLMLSRPDIMVLHASAQLRDTVCPQVKQTFATAEAALSVFAVSL